MRLRQMTNASTIAESHRYIVLVFVSVDVFGVVEIVAAVAVTAVAVALFVVADGDDAVVVAAAEVVIAVDDLLRVVFGYYYGFRYHPGVGYHQHLQQISKKTMNMTDSEVDLKSWLRRLNFESPERHHQA